MKSLGDNESVRPSGPTGMDGENGEGRSGVVGNERLTALAGAVLLVLILVELVSSASLHAGMAIHIFVGVGLSGHYTGSVATPLAGQIESALPTNYPKTTDPDFGLHKPSKEQFRNHVIGPDFLAPRGRGTGS